MAWTPFTRAGYDCGALRHASDTGDEERPLIEPFMPHRSSRGAKRRTSLRAVVDGIFHLLQSG